MTYRIEEIAVVAIPVPLWLVAMILLVLGYLAARAFVKAEMDGWRDEALWWRRNATAVVAPSHRAHDEEAEPAQTWVAREGAAS